MEETLTSQYVFEPTREQNILDLSLSNSPNLITHVSVTDTSLSDHRQVELFLSHNPCQPSPPRPPEFHESTFRALDFYNTDFTEISKILSSVDWHELWNLCDPMEFPELFMLVLLQISEICCPKKRLSTNKKGSLVRSISRKKRKIKSKLDYAKRNPHAPAAHILRLEHELALSFVDIRDAINKDLQYKEQQAAAKVSTNPKYFFSYAKQFSKQKNNIPMLFDENNNVCNSPQEIANILQRQFCSVFSDPNAIDIQAALFDEPKISKPFTDDMLNTSVEDFIEAIDETKPSAAAGSDGIPAILLKNCKDVIAPVIQKIWTKSMDSGEVPGFYKESLISPQHKRGSRAIDENYRAISLTSHIIKTYERVLRKKMVSHLEDNNLLCKNQHGFRSGKSCLTQLLHHFDEVLDSMAHGAEVDSIYLDYAKAFDKVDHQLLLKKLKLYGFSPKLVSWIESFLSNRSQRVVVDGHMSFTAWIISGVPQGTVLGPILFLIYINDIADCVTSCTLKCFADDTKISKAITESSCVAELQSDLIEVTNWSIRNNMTPHEDKYGYICHGLDRNNLLHELPFTSLQYQYITPSGSTLTPANSIVDLGVTVSNDLSWSPHINLISDKGRKMAAWVFSIFRSRHRDIMMVLYRSMVRSQVEYCSPLWNPFKIADIQEIESVQRSFTARIAGVQHLHYWDRLKALSLMSLQRRRERYIIIHMWKIHYQQCSNDLEITFVITPRFGIVAKIPPPKSRSKSHYQTLYEHSFGVMGPRLWNCIPAKIRAMNSLDHFKGRLTDLMLALPDTPPTRGYTPTNSNSIIDWWKDRDVSTLFGDHNM